ncbi:MAG: hypothetical protein H6553_05450 [Chitinophagales bacterium]|nr:hypothetical protein [Chitinophagales bacterium]
MEYKVIVAISIILLFGTSCVRSQSSDYIENTKDLLRLVDRNKYNIAYSLFSAENKEDKENLYNEFNNIRKSIKKYGYPNEYEVIEQDMFIVIESFLKMSDDYVYKLNVYFINSNYVSDGKINFLTLEKLKNDKTQIKTKTFPAQ